MHIQSFLIKGLFDSEALHNLHIVLSFICILKMLTKAEP